jgi:hypothetical protein
MWRQSSADFGPSAAFSALLIWALRQTQPLYFEYLGNDEARWKGLAGKNAENG